MSSDAEWDFCDANPSSLALASGGVALHRESPAPLAPDHNDCEQATPDIQQGIAVDKTRDTIATPYPTTRHSASISQPREEEDNETVDTDDYEDNLSFTSDLNPCESCGSFHHIKVCIYTLSWTDYLTYYTLYLSSLPHGLDTTESDGEDKGKAERDDVYSTTPPSKQTPTHQTTPPKLSDMALWQRASDLDAQGDANTDCVPNTRLKGTAMTVSARWALQDEAEWAERLANGSDYLATTALASQTQCGRDRGAFDEELGRRRKAIRETVARHAESVRRMSGEIERTGGDEDGEEGERLEARMQRLAV